MKKKLTVQLEINENEQGEDDNDNLQDHDYINNDNITAILEYNGPYHNQHLNESEVHEESRQFGNQELSSLSNHLLPTEPICSRVLKNVFHLMDQIKVPRRHELANDFLRKLRDALFVLDDEDKNEVEAILSQNRMTCDQRLLKNPRWIFRRVKRKYNRWKFIALINAG